MHPNRPLSAALLSVLALTLTGCATSFDPADSAPVTLDAGAISGTTFGGRQPIVGAQVYLLQASTTANAGPGIAASTANKSTNLLTSGNGSDSDGEYVLTDANGRFSVSGDYPTGCTAGDQVYLYSKGGKPDGANANTGAGLLAILGTCGSSFNSSTSVNMNEISTIAAAYAMAGYASDATHVGSSGSPNAITGIRNAFANANQLYDITSSAYTGHPSAPRSATPGGATVPVQQIETLADILANCVNSSTGSTQCTNLFTNGKSLLAVAPADTASAAIFMAQNQHNTSVYAVAGTPPYTNYYSSVPNDLSIQLAFTGGGLFAIAQWDSPMLAIDGFGNVWAAGGGTKLSEFSPLGVPANSGGYALPVSSQSLVSVAVDNATSPNVWLADGVDNYLVKFNIPGSSASTVAIASGGSPDGVAFNSSGNLWVTDFNLNGLYPINATTNAVGSVTTGNGLGNPGPPFIADNGNIWVNDTASDLGASAFTSAGAAIGDTNDGGTSGYLIQAVPGAVDSSNNGWFVRFQNPYVVKISLSGSTLNCTEYGDGGTGSPEQLAIDGNGNVWIADRAFGSGSPSTQNEILELNSAGSALTGATGFLSLPNTSQPENIAIDGSGNVWYLSSNDATLHEMIGAGAPTDVPLAHAVANNKVGARP